MMKKLLLLPILIVLTSCDPAPQKGADGYVFGKKQYTQTELNVSVVIYTDRESFLREAKKRKLIFEGRDLVAFSSLYPADQSKCTMHIIDPSVEYVPEFVGHEFLHCVHGQWHTSNLHNE